MNTNFNEKENHENNSHALINFLLYGMSFAGLRVVATYPYSAEITEKIGKDRIEV
jgi:ABC-type Zn uptake system ZnuABC Zn-binding protein ZnuA